MRTTQWVGVIAGLVALSACGEDALQPAMETGRVAGVLQLAGWSGAAPQFTAASDVRWSKSPQSGDVTPAEVIVAPDTVRVGQEFQVTTETLGPSGCWRAAGQDVSIVNRVVHLKPYDEHSGADVCTMALVVLAHTSGVTLNAPGEWTLRVTGRRTRVGAGEWVDEVISAEKTIFVK